MSLTSCYLTENESQKNKRTSLFYSMYREEQKREQNKISRRVFFSCNILCNIIPHKLYYYFMNFNMRNWGQINNLILRIKKALWTYNPSQTTWLLTTTYTSIIRIDYKQNFRHALKGQEEHLNLYI